MSIDKACNSSLNESLSLSLPSIIEHTLLKSDINENELIKHINTAKEHKVFGLCVPLAFVSLAKEELKDSAIKIITVIDFPKGNSQITEKIIETKAAKSFGADEIDVVIDYQAIIEKNYQKALLGIKEVVEEAYPMVTKVIVETSALSKYQLAIACSLVSLAKAHFIKTSTGFHDAGANVDNVILMRSLLSDEIGIKASGGIKDLATAIALVKAGANRIGTSNTVKILNEILYKGGYASN